MDETNSLFQRFLRRYDRGQAIFEQGATGTEMFIIHSGRVKISRRAEHGHDFAFAYLKSGDFFGEMAIIDGYPRSASAIAEEDGTEVIALDKQKFRYLVQQLPEFSLAIMERLAARLRSLNVEVTEVENGQ